MTRFLALCIAILVATGAVASDRYAGYYYPEITSSEEFTRVIRDGLQSNKTVRVDFVTDITRAQLAAPESPRFVVFAKGADARHLNIIALDDDLFATLYRARALLAQLTSNMRNNDFFRDQQLEHVATFFDFLQMLQFDTLVISDGKTWSHEVTFVRN